MCFQRICSKTKVKIHSVVEKTPEIYVALLDSLRLLRSKFSNLSSLIFQQIRHLSGMARALIDEHFYHVVTNMKRPQGRGLELAKKHISCCFQELDSMVKSVEFLRSINELGTLEDGTKNETTASGCLPVGFDSTLNSRLSAPTPPRAIETISWKKAVEYFQKLLHELEIICSYHLDPVLESVLRFVVEFQKFQPELVVRAHLQWWITSDSHLRIGCTFGERDILFNSFALVEKFSRTSAIDII